MYTFSHLGKNIIVYIINIEMGEKMNIYRNKKYKTKRLSYISSIVILFILLVFVTRRYIPNEISVFTDEEKTTNLSSNFFSIDNTETVIASNSSDKKITLENSTSTDEIITVKLLGIPIKSTKVKPIDSKKLIPSGENIGINIKTDGIMVLGTGSVTDSNGDIRKPWENKLQPKDILLKANDTTLTSKEQLTEIISTSENIDFLLERNGSIINASVNPVVALSDNKNKIGVWVRDGTEGIGTLTYINPDTNAFGALGHGVLDVDTNELMPVKSGHILDSNVTTINKGEKGNPGELVGKISSTQLGNILTNTNHGIYGEYTSQIDLSKLMDVGLRDDVKLGDAYLLCDIGDGVNQYTIDIEDINLKSMDEKSMVIRITDDTLLNKTNGIIQGMSGSPIIQDNKIIGAITHVFVQDPTKGYAIFIENMINEEKSIW